MTETEENNVRRSSRSRHSAVYTDDVEDDEGMY